MIIIRLCPITQRVASMNIPCTEAQLAAWEGGEMIQNAMPNVSPEDREFVLTGITPTVWANMFGGEEGFDNEEDEDDDDGSWQRELAMEAGMLGGIDAYNGAMGFGE